MSLESVLQRRDSLLTTVGKRVLHTTFPNDFELYVNALELVDKGGKTVEYFIFPVMPSSLSEDTSPIESIKKTQGGVTVLSNSNFVPKTIQLSGDFGRKMRLLIGTTESNLVNAFSADKDSNEFFPRIKTGYGTCKYLEKLLNKSKSVDKGGPYTLIFYNLAFGSSYIVRATSFKFSQSQEKNMIWSYTLTLQAIASLKDFQTRGKGLVVSIQNNAMAFVQSQVNSLISNLKIR